MMRTFKLALSLLLVASPLVSGTLEGGVTIISTNPNDIHSSGDAQYYNDNHVPAAVRLTGRHWVTLVSTGQEMAANVIDTPTGSYFRNIRIGGGPGACYTGHIELQAHEMWLFGPSLEASDGPACVPSNPPPGGGPPEQQYEGSPILVDLDRNGFHLRGTHEPVLFDLDADGMREIWTWTGAGERDGILVIDRNGNGYVENGSEMAGRVLPNGEPAEVAFDELAAWDQPEHGGNGDGWISPSDAVSASLRIWVDGNHNGVSEPGELLTMPQARVTRIAYRYVATRRQDEHGNLFRYRSRAGLLDSNGRERLDPIYDVFFFKAD